MPWKSRSVFRMPSFVANRSTCRMPGKAESSFINVSLTAIGLASYEVLLSKFVTWICAPKPITFSRTSFLKPTTIATERIMTANPKAIPAKAIRMTGGVARRFPSLPK